MRLKTIIWVQAYLRRCQSEGAASVIVRHGDDDSGAVFIKINRLDGTCRLCRPAPAGLDGAESERRWSLAASDDNLPEEAADSRLAQERSFDSDLWVIEVEDRSGRHFLDEWIVR